MTQKHTPTPWWLQKEDMAIYSADGQEIVLPIGGNQETNADFIVKACNSHYSLLNAAKALGLAIENGDPQTIADRWLNLRDIIIKAEGGAA